jgi:aspartate aminotransferase-like enzyme
VSKQLLFIPGPVTVSDAVLAAMAKPMVDHRGPEYKAIQDRIREKLKPIFGTAHEIHLLGSSGTGGLEAAVTNLFAPGEKVLACPIGVFGNRFIEIARTWGIDVEVLDTAWGAATDPKALKARLDADKNREIKGVLLTHNETSTGAQCDMAALAEAIRGHGAITLVDSVSGMAAAEFKMDEWGYDVVVAASQKALAVPPGMAMVAVSPRAWEKMAKLPTSRYYFDLRKARKFAEIGQTPWTPPVSVAYALDLALDLYAKEGAANVWARHDRYTRMIIAAAKAMNLEIFSQPGAASVTVTAIKVPAGIDGDGIRKNLRVNQNVVLGGGQEKLAGTIVRIGTMGDITPDDVLNMLGAFEQELAKAGHKLRVGAGVEAAKLAMKGEAVPA